MAAGALASPRRPSGAATLLLSSAIAGIVSVGCGVREIPHDLPALDPAAGVGMIELSGVPVAKEDAVAFIHFGHSNMAGRGRDPEALRRYFFEEADPFGYMSRFGAPPELALEPFTASDRPERLGGGPGTPLIKQAAALAPGTYFISLGHGKSSAQCRQYLPGSLYYDVAMQSALAIKDQVTFGAIVIMLGIAERNKEPTDITEFPECIDRLVTAIRQDVAAPDLPVLIADYEQGASGHLAPDSEFGLVMIPQIRRVPEVVRNSAVVPTHDLPMQDDHHFNLEGHMLWTQRVLEIMQDRGWFPWAH